MAGYTRNDTGNNIADGNVINASDLDGEYNAIEAAFNESTGHTHDGTSAEGAPITKVGPVQDVEISATTIQPKTASAGNIDLGASGAQFKDLYIDGLAYIDGLGENLLVNSTNEIQFRDSTLKINSSADGQLDIDADTELELTAPIVDINASTSVNISNDLKLDSDSAILSLGADSEVTLTHLHNVGTELKVTNATTSSVTDILDLQVESSGTPAVGIGTGLTFSTETASGNVEIGGAVRSIATGLTPTAEEIDLVFYSMRNGSLTEAFRYDSAADRLEITGGASVTADVNFGDNDKAIFGAGSDLQIYHDGSDSIISDQGTGDLKLTVNRFVVNNNTDTETMILATPNGAVSMYYDSNPKLATTATGINVTGTVTADGLTVDGAFTSLGIDDNADATAITIDSSERVLVGTDTNTDNYIFQVDSAVNTVAQFTRYAADGADLVIGSSRGTQGSKTALSINDIAGQLSFKAYQGSAFSSIASVNAACEAAPASGDTPGRLVFSTTADGASSPTERMRIAEDGKVGIGTGGDPVSDLEISKSDQTNGTTLTITNAFDGGSWAVDDILGTIDFRTDDTSTSEPTRGRIQSVLDAGGNWPYGTALSFSTAFNNTLSEAARIDSSQRVLIGHTSSPTDIWGGQQNRLQVIGNSWANSGLGLHNYANDATSPNISFSKSRSGTVGTSGTVLQDGDRFGFINFSGDDGTDINSRGAGIDIRVDGTPGSNDMPGRIVFETTADGASSPTERVRIDNAGRVAIGTQTPENYFSGADQLVIADTTDDAGITIVTPNDEVGRIHFADGTSGDEQYRGYVAYLHSEDRLELGSAGTHAMAIDSSQRVLIGPTTARANFYNGSTSPSLQIEGTTFSGAALSNVVNGTGIYPSHVFARSRGTSLGSNTIVQDDDRVGELVGQGSDGSEFVQCAGIDFEIDGTPGANDMPGRITFTTASDGAASTTERMRINNAGNVGIATAGTILSSNSGLDISSGGLSLVLGADNSNNTRTNNSTKTARIASIHYTNSEEPAVLATLSNTSTENVIGFGGGTSLCNAATKIVFSTAANNTTVNGTERMVIDSSGDIKAGTGGGWVGTVAESSSSSVIERGSNANGYYIKYADGTVFMWRSADVQYANAARLTTTFSLPVTLSTTSGAEALAVIKNATALESIGYQNAGPEVSYVTSTTQVQVRLYVSDGNTWTSGDNVDFSIFVSGYWY